MESVAYEELLKRDGQVMTHVVGNSMMPLLLDRESIVVVEDIERVPPRRGDVVLYKTGDTYILHRVLRIEPEEYVIRGDNTWTLENIPKTAVLATLIGFCRHSDDTFVYRDYVIYRLYRMVLPAIRWSRRSLGLLKRVIGKLS